MDQYIRALNTMGESGILWVDALFNLPVIALVDLSNILNVTYEELNVWIFLIIWPTLTVYQYARIFYLKRALVRAKSLVKARN